MTAPHPAGTIWIEADPAGGFRIVDDPDRPAFHPRGIDYKASREARRQRRARRAENAEAP